MNIKEKIITSVADRLNDLSVIFDNPMSDLDSVLNDALRELKIRMSEIETSIDDESELQFYVEVRAEYWAIHRIRNGQALNFKYSTGVEGRSVDKTAIHKQLTITMHELDVLWHTWYNDTYRPNVFAAADGGNLLNLSRRVSTTLAGDS